MNVYESIVKWFKKLFPMIVVIVVHALQSVPTRLHLIMMQSKLMRHLTVKPKTMLEGTIKKEQII